jgi:hypothetical protein
MQSIGWKMPLNGQINIQWLFPMCQSNNFSIIYSNMNLKTERFSIIRQSLIKRKERIQMPKTIEIRKEINPKPWKKKSKYYSMKTVSWDLKNTVDTAKNHSLQMCYTRHQRQNTTNFVKPKEFLMIKLHKCSLNSHNFSPKREMRGLANCGLL